LVNRFGITRIARERSCFPLYGAKLRIPASYKGSTWTWTTHRCGNDGGRLRTAHDGFYAGRKDLVAYTLNNPRVIRIEPPLVIGDEEIQWLVNAFQKALAKLDKLAKDLEV